MLKRVPIARVVWIDLDKVSSVSTSKRWIGYKTEREITCLHVLIEGEWNTFEDDECAVVMKMIERKYDGKS